MVARAERRRFLVRHGHGRRQPVNVFHVGLLELLQELPRVRGKTLDVPSPPLRVERIECETGLAAAAHAAKYDELAVGHIQIDVPQVMHPSAADVDMLCRHAETLSARNGLKAIRHPNGERRG